MYIPFLYKLLNHNGSESEIEVRLIMVGWRGS